MNKLVCDPIGHSEKTSGKIRVLYIAGCGRTGSTVLGNALGQIEGFINVGELREIWQNLVPGRPPCGCKTPVFACEMWKDVLDEAYGGVKEAPISQMDAFLMANTTVPAFWDAAFPWRARTLQRRLAEPLEALAKLYRAIHKVSNCQIIVDSSKRPMYMHKLMLMEEIDLHVIHLVRDPRSWAYAFLKRVAREGYVLHSKPFNSAVEWNRKNWSFEILSRQLRHRPLRLRYEDFVANPRASLESILAFISANSAALPLHDEHTLNLDAQHTVSGNPNRFKTGKTDVREDRQWETQMKTRDRMLVNALTWPLLVNYGYWTHRGAPDADENRMSASKRQPTLALGNSLMHGRYICPAHSYRPTHTANEKLSGSRK